MGAQDIAVRLPPYSFLSISLRRWTVRKNLLCIHFTILGILYFATAMAALLEGAMYISGGIGILQNPPFYAHLISGAGAVPLVLLLAHRIASIDEAEDAERVRRRFWIFLRRSRTKLAFFGTASLIGLCSLAYNLVLAFSYDIPIYDSPRFLATFLSYQLVRVYLYLFCYPLVFSATPVLTLYLFQALNHSEAAYEPFHFDGMGGFHRYFVAVDRPVYAVQTVAVAIALMNYIGWGEMSLVPTILSIAAPAVVTLLALFLFLHFKLVLRRKRHDEIRRLRAQQMAMYSSVRELASLSSKECFELLDRIEATERLISTVAKGGKGGLSKYIVNLLALSLTHVFEPLGKQIVLQILELWQA